MNASRLAAATRHDEARRVAQAYEVQVKLRKARWITATNPFSIADARRDLSEALDQLEAARRRVATAWLDWHGIV